MERTGQGGERVVLARWGPLMVVGMLAVTGGMPSIALVPLLGASDIKERVTLGLMATLLAVPFLVVVRRVPPMLRGLGIEIDGDGVRPFDGRRSTSIPWSDIAGVGFGSDLIRRHGTKRRSAPAFEIYLFSVADAAHYPGLRSDWRPVPTPAAGLSAGCFSYRLGAGGTMADQLEAAVRRHHPNLWRGPFVHDHPGPVEGGVGVGPG